MSKRISCVVILLVATLLMAADAPPKPQSVPADMQAALLKAQHQADQAQMDMLKLNVQYKEISNGIQQRITAAEQDMQKAQAAAFAAAKLDANEWRLNLEKMEFEPAAKPPIVAVPPAKK